MATTSQNDQHTAGQAAAAAARVAQEQFENLREKASEYYQEGRQRVQQVGEDLGQRIRQHPLEAILIAAGVGFLLGAIWRRR